MFDPDPSDVLLTLGEIAIAFAGFSSIVAIFQRRDRSGSGVDLFRFWIMLEFSLAALFFALLPFPIRSLGASDPQTWRIASALLLVFIVVHGGFVVRLVRRREPAVVKSLTPAMTVIANLSYALILASQLVNVTGWLGEPGFGAYSAGLFLLLLAAGINFVRLVWLGNPRLGAGNRSGGGSG